jgi:hypothetical protein
MNPFVLPRASLFMLADCGHIVADDAPPSLPTKSE